MSMVQCQDCSDKIKGEVGEQRDRESSRMIAGKYAFTGPQYRYIRVHQFMQLQALLPVVEY